MDEAKPITVAAIRERLRRCAAELSAPGVSSLHLFGSAARGEARADSDLDFVVEFRGTPSFGQYMDLVVLLEDALGRPVDLATARAIREEWRPIVDREAVRVA